MATYQGPPAYGLTVLSDHDPVVLCKLIRALPAGTEVVSIYAHSGSNVAWVQVPAPAEPTKPEPPKPGPKADEPKVKTKPTKEA
jgi:hypothetical protein